MFGSLGAPEILIIGLVVILLFGAGKVSGLGKDLGNSIKEFRKAVKDEDAQPAPQVLPPTQQTQYTAPQTPAAPQQVAQPPVQPPTGTSGKPNVF
jgi:sec-independent protein translocase protein TatA